MTGYIILVLVIIALMVIGFVRARRERMQEFEDRLRQSTLPSGKLLPTEETILALNPETLEALLLLNNDEYESFLQKEGVGEESFDNLPAPPKELIGEKRGQLSKDLDWLVNYAGHRVPEKREEGNPWIHLYEIGSKVKNKYHWIS